MQETLTGGQRKDVPGDERVEGDAERVLASLREALEAMSSAHAEGQRALEEALEQLKPPAVPAPSTEPDDPHGTWLQPAPWTDPRAVGGARAQIAPVEEKSYQKPVAAAVSTEAPTASRPMDLRRAYVGLQKRANEIDRLDSPEAIQKYLWEFAQRSGVRGMVLQEKGRALYAEDAFGFDNFAGDRRGRLRKVVVPYDPDGLFGATAQDRAPYSGPRPHRGLPVDLVLVMGKQAPDWCLVVPLPYRNRWGTFLYFDAAGDLLDALLEIEVVARLAVLQLRAARYRQHEPADRVRGFRVATLRERKRKRDSQRGDGPTAEASRDPLSKKRNRDAGLRQPLEANRFDADGNLVRPLDGNEILARIGELPTMPHVAARLIGLLDDPETEIKQLQEILSTDQSISVRLLQIANSSLYGNMREVANISEAIVRLGFTAIRSWLLSTVTRRIFVGDGATESTMRLWRQSVLCAIAAELIADRTKLMDPEIAFVGGLLQNIGQLVLARSHPDVFEEIDLRARAAQQPYVDLEQRVLGFDHADVGGILLQRWGLGDSLVAAVSSHHRVKGVHDDADRFAAIIALAEEFALRLGEGPTEGREDDVAELEAAARLGLDSDASMAIAEALAQRALDRDLFED